MQLDPIELSLFASRVTSICDEMGVVLRRSAFSPNIKDRLDFSCALFGPGGELFAQAAHIPVHLGSMAFAMSSIVADISWQKGDVLAVNDPYLGGTHLPDVTLISPVFIVGTELPIGFVANRAHHANIGCDSPGSMPVSTSLMEEGVIIAPTIIHRGGSLQPAARQLPGIIDSLVGDFAAQAGANRVGVERLEELVLRLGRDRYEAAMCQLNDYADRITEAVIKGLTPGKYSFEDVLDNDGISNSPIKLAVTLTIHSDRVELDFDDCADQVAGNLNCPEAVVAAAAYYCFRCLMPDEVPACSGLFKRITLKTRKGSVVNAIRPAAVTAGNVETSTRLVDLVFGALAKAVPHLIPAASQGTMNNIAMGKIDAASGKRWDYYETLAGGTGGGPTQPGLDCVHSHMTNTLNTPVESLEMNYPLRVRHYGVRKYSGGNGLHRGGNGIIREYEFLEATQLSLLTERRLFKPWGINDGEDGESGRNILNGREIPGKCSLNVSAGDRLQIETPGGGGWGRR